MPDLSQAVDSAGMAVGDDLWLVGQGSGSLGGSVADTVYDLGATKVPLPLVDPLPRYRAVHSAIRAGLVAAAHDCSDGGVAVAVAEMAIAARHGVAVTVPADGLDQFTALTNEGPGRLVLAAHPSDRDRLGETLGSHGRRIGEVTADVRITLTVATLSGEAAEEVDAAGADVIVVDLQDAVAAFTGRPPL